jgi:transposase InsO family protein
VLLPGRPTESLRPRLRRDRPDPVGRTSQIHRNPRTTNAVCESFHATLEKELLRSRSFKTRQEAKTAIFDWIEAWYNPLRRHSRLGYRSPDQYEQAHDRVSTETPDINYRQEEQKAA